MHMVGLIGRAIEASIALGSADRSSCKARSHDEQSVWTGTWGSACEGVIVPLAEVSTIVLTHSPALT